jgi:hypothetical protein
VEEFAMKNVPAAIACLVVGLMFVTPSLNAQKRKPAAVPQPAVASPMDSEMADLARVTAATQSDLADLSTEKHSFNWKTAWRFWHRESSTSTKTQQIADSLQRNLRDAMPGLIHDAQTSGSFTATFKLYNNLSVLCELLDSLAESTGPDKKGPLANDSAAMGRIRQDLATFLEQKAAALDATGKPPYPWTSTASSNGKAPKKIVIDDNVPEKKPVTKRTVASQQ